MNEIQVTVRGNVASEPRQIRFDDGNVLTSFRVASNARYFDRGRQAWIDRDTTFLSVKCRRALGDNVLNSLRKGQPVVVSGRMHERSWYVEDRLQKAIEIEAETLGHDLGYGTSTFDRVVRTELVRSADQQREDALATEQLRETEGIKDVSRLAVLPGGGTDRATDRSGDVLDEMDEQFDEMDDDDLDDEMDDEEDLDEDDDAMRRGRLRAEPVAV